MRQKKWKTLLTQKNSKKGTVKSRVNTRATLALDKPVLFCSMSIKGFKPKNGLKSLFSKSVDF